MLTAASRPERPTLDEQYRAIVAKLRAPRTAESPRLRRLPSRGEGAARLAGHGVDWLAEALDAVGPIDEAPRFLSDDEAFQSDPEAEAILARLRRLRPEALAQRVEDLKRSDFCRVWAAIFGLQPERPYDVERLVAAIAEGRG